MLLPLFNCVIPANVGIIFKGLMYIAALDVIPTDDIYVNVFDEEQFGEAQNSNYEAVGFETKFMILNLGSLGLTIMLYPFLYLWYYIAVQF